MLIDTHCHLDAAEFALDRATEVEASIQQGVHAIIVPAVCADNFQTVIDLAQQYTQCWYALGWHPMYIDRAQPSDMHALRQLIAQQLQGPNKLLALGEIGLDYFVTKQNVETQTYFFSEQLKIAQSFDLPVILHVRRAVDEVLKYLRRFPVRGGIAHAFNGSVQQAEIFVSMGFKLGFGGAMTYTRASKIRALAKTVGLDAIVLETDAPDIPPEWVGQQGRNSPKELLKIAEVLAELRGMQIAQIIEITSKNSVDIFPKLAHLYTPLEVLH
ncbi:MAG: DNAase [Methylophilaceae bacterium 17-44-8]|jgi:TatD DNase family protein|nr:MAG: DNAase [Methylophilaceae bacterium 17-44-8]